MTQFGQRSLERIVDPDHFEGSLGLFVLRSDEGGSLHDAGVRAGDVLISAAGEPLSEPNDLGIVLSGTPGETVAVEYLRDGEKHIAQVERGRSAGASVSQLIILVAVQL